MSPNPVRLFERVCRVTVDNQAITYAGDEPKPVGRAYDGLRVGFTIEKDLSKRPNSCELIIYNLSRSTRKRLADADKVPVVIEAGYREVGLTLLFAGEMREAFSRAEQDGAWATILRAGDADQAIRKSRKAASFKPGVSLERVMTESMAELKVGLGNVFTAIKNGNGKVDKALGMGVNLSGSLSENIEKMMKSDGLEMSVQDQEMQVLSAGKALSIDAKDATFLSPATGLEGAPETTNKGQVTCRARIMPGLSPGYPVELDHATTEVTRIGSGWWSFDITPQGTLYVVEKCRYVGDTWGQDWNAELTLRELPP